jgi:MFS family permease
MADPGSPIKALDVWKERNFAWYMGGSTIALVGMWVQRVALFWLAWELTNSERWLGLLAFADLFPTVVITPLAGAMADRMSRLNMARVSHAVAVLQAFALAWLAMTGRLSQPDDVWWLLGLTFVLGVAMAFATAARLAMVPDLIEARFLPAALANDAAIFNAARMVGPMAAAFIITQWGAGIAFLANGIGFAIYLGTLFIVRANQRERAHQPAGNVLSQTWDGVKYASRHPGIGPALILLVAISLGVKPFLDFLPAISDRVFSAGVEGFASLAAAAGGGAMAAAVWMVVRRRVDGLTRITLWAPVLGAGGIVVLCVSPVLWIGLIGAFFAGASITINGTGLQTLMQNAVDRDVRGRVMALYGMVNRGGPAVAALGVGMAAEVIGVQIAVAAAALLFCAPSLMWVFVRRATMTRALEKPADSRAS